MNKNNILGEINRRLTASKLTAQISRQMNAAYKLGYEGVRHPGFTTIGEDSNLKDINRAIRVHIINRNNEAAEAEINAATLLLRPVLKKYIHGLKDGRRDNGNAILLDLSAPIKRLIASQAAK